MLRDFDDDDDDVHDEDDEDHYDDDHGDAPARNKGSLYSTLE